MDMLREHELLINKLDNIMSKVDKQNDLISILEETKCLVLHPENNFAWSWPDCNTAINELDRAIEQIRAHDYSCSQNLSLIFAPTGNLQELAISSGWHDIYMELSSRFDEVIKSFGE